MGALRHEGTGVPRPGRLASARTGSGW